LTCGYGAAPAGAGITEKRGLRNEKKRLSKAEPIYCLIYKLIQNKPNQVNTIISASAIGYYSDRGDELLTEESLPVLTLWPNVAMDWETPLMRAVHRLRILKFRTGVVLDKNGGAMPQMAMPVKLGLGLLWQRQAMDTLDTLAGCGGDVPLWHRKH